MPKTTNLEALRAKHAALSAALDAARRDDTDPVAERLRAIASEIALRPDDETLHAEHARLLNEARPEVDDRRKRIADLSERVIDLEAQVRVAEQQEIDRVSLDARTKAVAAVAPTDLAAKCDEAASAWVEALRAYYRSVEAAEEPISTAAAMYLTHGETQLLAYARLSEAAKGHTGAHGAAIAAVVARALEVSGSAHTDGLVKLSPITPVPRDATMVQAVAYAAGQVADVLRVRRS
jgi:hypothetical protein